MKKLLACTAALGFAMSMSGVAFADSALSVWCNPAAGTSAQGYFIQCNVNLNGSLAADCACPRNYVLIDPTNFPPSNGPGAPNTEPLLPSRA